jgi:hypothetical protein
MSRKLTRLEMGLGLGAITTSFACGLLGLADYLDRNVDRKTRENGSGTPTEFSPIDSTVLTATPTSKHVQAASETPTPIPTFTPERHEIPDPANFLPNLFVTFSEKGEVQLPYAVMGSEGVGYDFYWNLEQLYRDYLENRTLNPDDDWHEMLTSEYKAWGSGSKPKDYGMGWSEDALQKHLENGFERSHYEVKTSDGELATFSAQTRSISTERGETNGYAYAASWAELGLAVTDYLFPQGIENTQFQDFFRGFIQVVFENQFIEIDSVPMHDGELGTGFFPLGIRTCEVFREPGDNDVDSVHEVVVKSRANGYIGNGLEPSDWNEKMGENGGFLIGSLPMNENILNALKLVQAGKMSLQKLGEIIAEEGTFRVLIPELRMDLPLGFATVEEYLASVGQNEIFVEKMANIIVPCGVGGFIPGLQPGQATQVPVATSTPEPTSSDKSISPDNPGRPNPSDNSTAGGEDTINPGPGVTPEY